MVPLRKLIKQRPRIRNEGRLIKVVGGDWRRRPKFPKRLMK